MDGASSSWALRSQARSALKAGAAYVIFGVASSGGFPLSQISAYGFEIDGAIAGTRLGNAVSGVGDVNGDGRADLVVKCTPRRQRQGLRRSCLRRLRARAHRHRGSRSRLHPASAGFRADGAGRARPARSSAAAATSAGIAVPTWSSETRMPMGTRLRTAARSPSCTGSAHRACLRQLRRLLPKPLAATAPATAADGANRRPTVSPPLPTGLTLDPKTGVICQHPPTEQSPRRPTPSRSADLRRHRDRARDDRRKRPRKTTATSASAATTEDTTAPRLTLAGLTSQRLLRTEGNHTIRATCNEPCARRQREP